ncbi:MAG: hypothetical protein B6A08_08575 [Sorangiineae bacterium NIC37A_2]|nr:MAG: hypothetical protein B6A08_08575 [Sorangiineae bacterium NIC37A_2]
MGGAGFRERSEAIGGGSRRGLGWAQLFVMDRGQKTGTSYEARRVRFGSFRVVRRRGAKTPGRAPGGDVGALISGWEGVGRD